VRVHVVLGGPGTKAHLAVEGANPELALLNPGSPVVSRTPLAAPGGKYNHPTVAHGLVLLGTDRLSAFRGP